MTLYMCSYAILPLFDSIGWSPQKVDKLLLSQTINMINFVPFILLCATVLTANSPIFIHQCIIYGGSSTLLAQNSSSVYYYPLPAPYDSSFSRSIFFSGIKATLTDTINFTLTLQPYSSASAAYINLELGPMNLFTVSSHVVFVETACTWLWAIEGSHDYGVLSNKDGGSDVEDFTVYGPSVIDAPANFEVHHFLQYFWVRTYLSAGNQLGIQVQHLSPAAPNALSFRTTRATYSVYQKVALVIVMIKTAQLVVNAIPRFNSDYLASEASLLVPGTYMGIPSVWENSGFYGFQGNCGIGLQKIYFGTDGSVPLTRSVLFNQDTNPFNGVQNQIMMGDTFSARWRVLCLMGCPSGSVYDSGTCVVYSNSISNCMTPANNTHCAACDLGYYLADNETACIDCLSATFGACGTCTNETTCQTCASNGFSLVGSVCYPCSSLIGNCLLCNSNTDCIQCLNDTYRLLSPLSCQKCNVSIPLCLRCDASGCLQCQPYAYVDIPTGMCNLCVHNVIGCLECTDLQTCTLCQPTYYLQSFADGSLGCLPCPGTLLNCYDCSGPGTCSQCDPGYLLNSGSCMSCSTSMANCTSCLNSTFCTGCTDNHSYLQAGFNTQLCFLCGIPLSNCLTCLNSTHCTGCVNNTFFLQLNTCVSCSIIGSNCQECYSVWLGPVKVTRCSTCLSDIYFVNSSYACQLCSAVMGNCTRCNSSTYCTECINSSYTFISAFSDCLLCSDMFPHCQECSATTCTVCQEGLHSLDGGLSCQCVLGDYVSGVCSQITGCVDIFVNNEGKQVCLACDTALYKQRPVDNACVCREGQLINGICSTIEGCIVPILNTNDNSISCMFCNITKGYTPKPVNNKCVCPNKYQNVNGTCQQICGDGYYMGKYGCDDGNLVEGDGCSPTCAVQVGYRCYNGTPFQPSACVYVGIPLQLQLKNIKRNQELNQGVFKFSISPALININKMDLTQYIALNCQDTTYEVSSISYDHSGLLTISTDYSTDMEGRSCTLQMSFDSNIIRSPNTSLSFDAVSSTLKLIIINKQQQYKTFKVIFKILSYIALGIFVFSLGYKMVGAETITCCQLVYLSNAFYHQQYFFFNLLKQFGLVTGSWPLFYNQNDSQFMTPFSQRVEMTASFAEDSIAVAVVLLTFGSIWAIMKIYHYCKTKEDEQGNKIMVYEQQKLKKVEWVIRQLYRVVIFPVAAGFMIVLIVSAYVDITVTSNGSDSVFPSMGNSIIILVTLSIMSAVAAVELTDIGLSQDRQNQLRGMEEAKPWYIRIFIMRSVLVSLLIQLGILHQFEILIYALVLLQLVYFIVILSKRPYSKAIDNIGLIFCESTILFAFFLPLAMRFITIQETTEMLITLVIQALLILVLTFSLIRVFLHYKGLISDCLFREKAVVEIQLPEKSTMKLMKKEERQKKGHRKNTCQNEVHQKVEAEEKSLHMEMLANPYSLYNKKEYKGIERLMPKTKRQNSEARRAALMSHSRAKMEEEEDQELRAIKKRLREDLILKKK